MTKLSSVSWLKQPDGNGGLLFDTLRTFVASGAGSTTTIVSTGLGATIDSDDDFVGWIVECTDATNTQNQNLRRRILEVADGTSTLTTDAWPAATDTADQFVLYKPPHALAVAAAGSSTTTNHIITRDRNETNGRYAGLAVEAGPYVVVVAADNASVTNHILISTNTAAESNIVLSSSLSGAVALGDYFEIWSHPEIMNDALLDLVEETIERPAMTGSYGRPANVPGLRSGSGTMEIAFRGPGTGRAGLHAEAHELLSTVMDHTDSAGNSTVDAGSTTTAIEYSSGNHVVGELGLTAEGSACMVTADDGANTYTVTPATDIAAVSTSTFYGMTTYKLTGGCLNAALAIQQWRGKDILEYAWGCVPNLSFNAAKGDFLKIAAAFQVADWMRVGASGTALSRAWGPKRSTVDQLKLANGRAVLDTTSFKLRSLTMDLGLDIQMRNNTNAPNDTDGFETVGDNPTGLIEVYNGDNERKALDDFLAGKEIQLIAQWGKTPGFPGVMVFYAYRIRYTGSTIGDDAGQITISLPFQVIEDPGAPTGVPRLAIGIC
jgi:hypothetical protein